MIMTNDKIVSHSYGGWRGYVDEGLVHQKLASILRASETSTMASRRSRF